MKERRPIGVTVFVYLNIVTGMLGIFLLGMCSGCSNKTMNSSILSQGWRSEIIDSKGDVGSYSSIALDRNNNPHIAYYSEEGLKYAFRNNTGWKIQIIEKGRFAGQDPKIALDSYGRPHITYFFFDQKQNIRAVKYAHWNGSEWQIMFITKEGSESSIAIDSKNRPHIASATGYGIEYAYWDGEIWHKQKIDVLGDWRQYKELTPKDRYFGRIDISLALDDNDNPHIAYFNRISGDLRYICLVDGRWNIQIVDKEGLVGLEPSIAVDSRGRVHITYLQADNYDLKYAYWDGNAWSIQTIDEKNNTGCNSIIRLDRYERPHIIYCRCADEELKYAYWTGSKWNVTTIEKRKIGWFTPQSDTISFDLDVKGNPHISCYDNHKKALKYIWKF